MTYDSAQRWLDRIPKEKQEDLYYYVTQVSEHGSELTYTCSMSLAVQVYNNYCLSYVLDLATADGHVHSNDDMYALCLPVAELLDVCSLL